MKENKKEIVKLAWSLAFCDYALLFTVSLLIFFSSLQPKIGWLYGLLGMFGGFVGVIITKKKREE